MELVAELPMTDAGVSVEALVAEHQRMVYRIAFSVLHNHHDAEDAAQEAFVRLWRAAGKLGSVGDPKAWVARIAWNAATDRLRQQRTPAAAAVSLDVDVAAVRRLAAQGATAEQIASGAEMQRLMAALIASLPAKLRSVVELCTVEELDAGEVAQALDLAPTMVRMRLFEGRRLLREKLDRVLGKHV